MTPEIRAQAIALHDQFTHEDLDRRSFLSRMTILAGSLAAAEALIATIGANPAAAAVVPADDKRLRTETITLPAAEGRPPYKAYLAEPRSPAAALATVIVIHENRGLNEHTRDVARRVALAGHRALAVDFLSPSGGTPANEDAARTAIGKLDLGQSVQDATFMLGQLSSRPGGNGRVGAVGFCWGGAFVNRLALAAGPALAGGVAYYGTAPAPAEASRVVTPLLLHFAGLDERVNATGLPWVAALKTAGKPAEAFVYPGVNHAFNNDTSAERYDAAAAALAWTRTLAFLSRNLSA